MTGLPDNLQSALPRVAVIASSDQNSAALPEILCAIGELGLTMIVVSDEPTDQARVFPGGREASEMPRARLSHAGKHDKAAALSGGFWRARELGFTHALTIETNGQHDPADIPALLAMCLKSPEAIVLGNRDAARPDSPRKLLIGKISRFFLLLISGLSVADSQCGLRIYPLEAIARIYSGPIRSTFKTEILAYAGFAGLPVVQVPVRLTGPPPKRSPGVPGEANKGLGRWRHAPGKAGERFARWPRSLPVLGMYFRLLARSLWPMRFATASPSSELETGTIFDRLRRWSSPARTWRKLRYDINERDRLASSVGWGAFMAFQPYFGFKTLICLALAKVFRLQPLVVIGVSSLTSPPIGLIAWTVSIVVGNWMLHGSALLPPISFDHGPIQVLRRMAVEWCVGGLAIGCVVGPMLAILCRQLLRKLPLTSDAQITSNVPA